MTGELVAGHALESRATLNAALDVEALVAREAPGLLAYFARRVATLDDAADLLGDTLLVVWRKKVSIPADETRARMWMYGVARKVLSSTRRATARRGALTERLRLELHTSDTVTHRDDSLQAHVRALIADLSDTDQEIMKLVYWEGFSFVGVATIMSMRPATVRSRHARARARLRTALSESGDVG